MKKKSFTMLEMVIVLLIIGIGAGLFFSVLSMNTVVFDNEVVRNNLWHELDQIIELMSSDGRVSSVITVPDNKTVNFTIPGGNIVTYRFLPPAGISPYGQLQMTRPTGSVILSENVDFAQSQFNMKPFSVEAEIYLEDNPSGINRLVRVNTSIEITRRTD